MNSIALLFVLAFLTNAEDANADVRRNASILSNFENIIKGQTVADAVTCENVSNEDFELLLYTRKNPMYAISIDKQSPDLDSNKKLVIIVHGWGQLPYDNKMQNLKNAYLNRYDTNVIIVNWEKLALDYYRSIMCKVPKLGQKIAEFLCTLNKNYGIDLDDVHLVGHCVGAHMAGIIGQTTNSMCQEQIGRITGLDPMGPLYNNAPKPQRLDASDANFVDIIHTNAGFLGYHGNCGHVDFYVNCGAIQVGCALPDDGLKSTTHLPLSIGTCHHMRSIDIWAEAVETDNFKATPCYYCPMGCPPVLSMNKEKIIMGEKCPKNAKGGYYVKTDDKRPYALLS